MWGAKAPTLGELVIAICLIGVVGTVYATVGGVRAVVWVDVIQFLIVVGTAVVSICFLLQRNHLDFAGMVDGLTNGSGEQAAGGGFVDGFVEAVHVVGGDIWGIVF